ncbi:hypothetical protein OIE67_22655 [Nonomuraea fuscirosea]|jgi:hypothetical protein|uniref:hypothetical protein n=1 Tax=Nonomuraea fuscirosea TaxID=1291556 RepID=UPI002DD7E0CF|nr:hypothetical protein [Nonomuraea fuscirosea]WSA57310.1 hypothetical protein OIE67_22655 [Nonomuraea fuscirosea]
MAFTRSTGRRPVVVLGAAAVLGTVVTLLTGGSAAASASTSTSTGTSAAVALAVACSDGSIPRDYYFDSSYNNPNACLKCQAAGAVLEATGNWRAFCKRRYNPAGTLTRVDLYRFCLVCRSPEAVRAGRP